MFNKQPCTQHAFGASGAFLLGSTFVLSIIFDYKFELEYFLTPPSPSATTLQAMGLRDIQRKIRFGLVGFFHRPASTEKLNRIGIIHVFQRPSHHIA